MPDKRRKDLWVLALSAGVGLLPIYIVFMFLLWFGVEMWTQATLGPNVEARYGFKVGGFYTAIDGKDAEPLTLHSLAPGRSFAAAGLVDGDIIVSHRTLGSFYRDLDRSQGQATTLSIVPGGDGVALARRPQRQVTVIAP